jgi:hypothetical protein
LALKEPGVFTAKPQRALRLYILLLFGETEKQKQPFKFVKPSPIGTRDLARRSIYIKQRSFSFADCPSNEKYTLGVLRDLSEQMRAGVKSDFKQPTHPHSTTWTHQ